MTFGPGKYDDLCTLVREKAGVDEDGAAVVIIIGGNKGPGFCVQATLEASMLLPDILESVAKQIRKDILG
jgi:hypothetical protein